jgi:Got1/Sft2-like family
MPSQHAVLSITSLTSTLLCIRRDRIRATICFFLGIALVVMRWGLIGMALEGFGFLNLFGNFLPTVLTVARQLPGLRTILDFPIISQAADFIAGKTRPKYSV